MPDDIPASSDLEVEHTRTRATNFPSSLGIGDPVWVTLQGHRLVGWVRAATFTNSKVRYAVYVTVSADTAEEQELLDYTTLHNLDSVLVTSRSGQRREWGPDNYS